MMKRFLVVVALIATLAMVLVGCQPKEANTPNTPVAPKTEYITIATGGTGGVYFPLGGKMAEILSAKVPNLKAGARSTGASVANINFLKDKEVELALIQNDITYYAHTGSEMFKDKKVDTLRGIATIYDEVVQLIARADANINSIEDLKGKKVAVGAAGSGTEANARQILTAFGVKYEDLGKVEYLSFDAAAAQLTDGHIHAAFVTSGTPTAAVMNMANSINVKLIPVEGASAANLKNQYKHYTSVVIPANTYKNQTTDVETVSVRAMLVVHADLSEETVYNITKALFENLNDFGAAHARAKDLTLATSQDGMPIPLHPGADKYFKEKK